MGWIGNIYGGERSSLLVRRSTFFETRMEGDAKLEVLGHGRMWLITGRLWVE